MFVQVLCKEQRLRRAHSEEYLSVMLHISVYE